ncbi:MAG: leucine zipper domain-containing protein [Bacteroidota bacterium]|nr:leucine zipper domain-containing protein [Bacteroidota bacterium]
MSDNSLKLKNYTTQDIKTLLETEIEYKKGLKLFAAYLVSKNWSARQIAKLMDVSFKQITLWVHDFDKEGTQGLEEKTKPGRTPKLSVNEKQKLKKIILSTSPADYDINSSRWKGDSVMELIKSEFNIKYKTAQVYNIIRSLKIKYIGGQWHEL